MAAALFFALLSVGALLKGDEVIGIGFGLLCAVMAAFFMKKSIMQADMSEEENHQRLEIQFQQLRQRLGDGGSTSSSMMQQAITTASDQIQEILHEIQSQLSVLENLTQINESSGEVKTLIQTAIEESQAQHEVIKKSGEVGEQQLESLKSNLDKFAGIEEKLKTLTEQSSKLNELTESGQSTVQTGLKLLQVVGQMLKAPPFAKDITQLNETMNKLLTKFDSLEELKKTTAAISANVAGFAKINNEIAESIKLNGQTAADGVSRLEESINAMSENSSKANETAAGMTVSVDKAAAGMTVSVDKASAEMVAAISEMQEDIVKLTTKIDAYNGLMKMALEQYSSLTDHDVRVLEKIAEKVQ